MRRCTVQRTAPSHRPMYSSPLIGFTLIWLLSSALWWVLLLAWLVGCTQASSLHTLPLLVLKVSAQTEGPINEEAFPFSLSLPSLFTYMWWPPHTLHQLSFASFLPIWLIHVLFSHVHTRFWQDPNPLLWMSLDAFVRAIGCGSGVVQVAAVTSFPLTCVLCWAAAALMRWAVQGKPVKLGSVEGHLWIMMMMRVLVKVWRKVIIANMSGCHTFKT